MLQNSKAFSGFSVNDLKKAREFYEGVLGLKVTVEKAPGCDPMLNLHLASGAHVMIYAKQDHVPATFTILNFPVHKITKVADELTQKGINFIHYDGTDEHGVSHNAGPLIAWFKDPAGNYLSLIQVEEVHAQDEFKMSQIIPSARHEVFRYFTEPKLLEKWSYPDGLTLKVPFLEAKKSGSYRFEHTGLHGVFICTGYMKDFKKDKLLVQIDTGWNPDGKLLFNNLECIIEFKDLNGETEVKITQRGFPDEKSLKDCQHSWIQCLDNLLQLFDGRLRPIERQVSRGTQHYQH